MLYSVYKREPVMHALPGYVPAPALILVQKGIHILVPRGNWNVLRECWHQRDAVEVTVVDP